MYLKENQCNFNQWSVWPLTTTLCCGQRSLQWTKMWTKAYFTRLSNTALPLVSSLALTWLVLYFALNLHCFLIPLLFFLPLVSSLARPSSAKPKICLAAFCRATRPRSQLILILDQRISCILLKYFSRQQRISQGSNVVYKQLKKTPGICILFVDFLSKKKFNAPELDLI